MTHAMPRHRDYHGRPFRRFPPRVLQISPRKFISAGFSHEYRLIWGGRDSRTGEEESDEDNDEEEALSRSFDDDFLLLPAEVGLEAHTAKRRLVI